jgi:hypothetical protein
MLFGQDSITHCLTAEAERRGIVCRVRYSVLLAGTKDLGQLWDIGEHCFYPLAES